MNEAVFPLRNLDLSKVDQSWGVAHADQGPTGKPLQIAGRGFAQGVAVGADSILAVRLDQKVKRLRAWVGMDDVANDKTVVRFSLVGDGKTLWNSGPRKRGEAAVPVEVDVSRVRILQLCTDSNSGGGVAREGAVWADANFEGCTQSPVALNKADESDKRVWQPGRRWYDTSGNLIQAHGGGILRHNNRWYWFGEDRSKGYVGIGVSGYVSRDLHTWKHLGVVLPRSAYDQKHGDQNICERPKVMYNPRTRQFVLWFHYDRSGYGDSQAGVAIADRIEGPYRFLGMHRPIASGTFRDMNLFVDDDHSAYVFYSSEENATMHVVRLDTDWTAPEAPMVEGKTWARILVRQMREAPAPFKHQGKYWLVTSGCTGWDANPADVAVADHPFGPWQELGNPCVGDGANRTFQTQSTAVIPHPSGKPGEFIFLADRWFPQNLADSRYVWLPLRFRANRPAITWEKQWR